MSVVGEYPIRQARLGVVLTNVLKRCSQMKTKGAKPSSPATRLPKCPTGIQGLDEITGGGLPRGRPTLVCGGAGCGKTLLAAEFLKAVLRSLSASFHFS